MRHLTVLLAAFLFGFSWSHVAYGDSGSQIQVANGIAVHNSIEQDADMVILLHREEAYEKETQRAGEADLIVAKHRNGPTDTIVVAFQGHYSRFTNMAQQF